MRFKEKNPLKCPARGMAPSGPSNCCQLLNECCNQGAQSPRSSIWAGRLTLEASLPVFSVNFFQFKLLSPKDFKGDIYLNKKGWQQSAAEGS